MKKTVLEHNKYKHRYVALHDMNIVTIREYNEAGMPGASLQLTQTQYSNFMKTLEKGGWYEQSKSR